jgi:hypothetical protein
VIREKIGPTDSSWGILVSVEEERERPERHVPSLEIVVSGIFLGRASKVSAGGTPAPAGQMELVGELCLLLGIEVI